MTGDQIPFGSASAPSGITPESQSAQCNAFFISSLQY